jgi:ketosteroid isomerase-like protein
VSEATQGQEMTTDEKLHLIRRYYDACSAGDIDALVQTVHENVTHYFLAPNPGSTPVSGSSHLARYWRKVQARVDGRWVVDSIIGEGDEAVIEWTLYWSPPGSGERVATRGAEWYRLEDRRIAEIRAYYQQLDISSELEGFDYAGRGYSAVGREASTLHPLPERTA